MTDWKSSWESYYPILNSRKLRLWGDKCGRPTSCWLITICSFYTTEPQFPLVKQVTLLENWPLRLPLAKLGTLWTLITLWQCEFITIMLFDPMVHVERERKRENRKKGESSLKKNASKSMWDLKIAILEDARWLQSKEVSSTCSQHWASSVFLFHRQENQVANRTCG